MKPTPEIATIASLPDGSTIERQLSPRRAKWFLRRAGKRILLDNVPRWELLANYEAFILKRFAQGATIHSV